MVDLIFHLRHSRQFAHQAAQATHIPWRPKPVGPAATVPKPKAPPGNKAAANPPQAGQEPAPDTFSMTYDTLTTLSPGVYLAQGNVRFVYRDMLLTADAVTYDSNTGKLRADGRVAVDFADFTVSGSRLEYDVQSGTGRILDAYGVQSQAEYTVTGSEIRKTGEGWFEVVDGVFTSCAAGVPPWSMKASRAKFHVDHYAYLTAPRFRVRNVPVVPLPYLIWPIKPERSSGLLIPAVGSSSTKGFTFSHALFLAPADWWDDTIYADYYEKKGVGVGEELRYALTPRDYGWFHGYYIREKDTRRRRWDATWTHLQTFRKGWYAVADVNLLSDINFVRDYQRDYTLGTASRTDSRIWVGRTWGPYGLAFRAERRLQYFTEGRELTQRMLPGLEFRSALQPLAGGLYAGFESSVASLHKEWADYVPTPQAHSLTYARYDLHPYLEWPLHPATWLDATPRIEGRATYYGSSRGDEPSTYDGGSLWRTYAKGSLDLTGPRFYRRFGDGLKHVVEPFVTYTTISADANASKTPLYDEVDLAPVDYNAARVGVRNRLLGAKGRLILDSEVFVDRSFGRDLTSANGTGSRSGPVTMAVRWWPSQAWSTDLSLRYSTLVGSLVSQSLAVAYRPKAKQRDDFVRLAYLKTKPVSTVSSTPEVGTAVSDTEEIHLTGSFTVADGHVTMTPFLERDLLQKKWRNQRLIFWYRGSCYSVGFELGRRTIGDFRDTTYRFLVSLKGAGTVLDVWGGGGGY